MFDRNGKKNSTKKSDISYKIAELLSTQCGKPMLLPISFLFPKNVSLQKVCDFFDGRTMILDERPKRTEKFAFLYFDQRPYQRQLSHLEFVSRNAIVKHRRNFCPFFGLNVKIHTTSYAHMRTLELHCINISPSN